MLSRRERKALENVIDYLWHDEEKDYGTYKSNSYAKKKHIFLDLLSLEKFRRREDKLWKWRRKKVERKLPRKK